ncbi:MAG: response regulator [Magnetospirillum sp.]|nr:response regulator [Magnetospirillum sp.]
MTEANPRVLVVEDEQTIADILMDYLRKAGFQAHHLANGSAAIEVIRRDPPDLVVLDLMLPGVDGVAVCREVRRFSTVPVIMATARVEEVDRLLGLEVGADDYICKPFSPREVVARVAAVLRRSGRTPAGDPAPPRVDIDEAGQRIAIQGQRLDLTPTEYRLLRLLASHPGRIYSRAQILDLAYHQDQEVSDRIIDSHIKNIRRKVAAILPEANLIQAVYGVGYRFEM